MQEGVSPWGVAARARRGRVSRLAHLANPCLPDSGLSTFRHFPRRPPQSASSVDNSDYLAVTTQMSEPVSPDARHGADHPLGAARAC